VGRSIRHHGRASSGNREEPSLGLGRANGARLAACHRSRKGEGVTRLRKGRRSRSPSLRGLQEPGFGCPHVVTQLQKSVGDVWPRISSANALQKGRQGRVNGGLARSDSRRVIPSAGASGEGYSRESASPPRRERTGARSRVTRDRHPAVFTSPRRCGGRGTGAVRATGSYEGSLSMEGIPDHHEASAFTRRRQRWSWRSNASYDPSETFQKKDRRPDGSTGEGR